MNTKELIQDLRALIRKSNDTIQDARNDIQRLQQTCAHSWELCDRPHRHSEHHRWLMHFKCTECGSVQTVQYDVPLCTACEMPLEHAHSGEADADRAYASAMRRDRFADRIETFRCPSCGTFHAFPVRGII